MSRGDAAPPRRVALTRALTHREREVVALHVEGWTARQIAIRLHISERTVEGHLSRIADLLPYPHIPRGRRIILFAAHLLSEPRRA